MKAQGAQKECEKSKALPADVTAIIEKSCIGCHSDDGSTLAKSHFNFTKWNEYTAEEQTSIGQDILKMVTTGKMPPKKFLKNNPEAKLSTAEKQTISNWAGKL
jgi:mono/diheme cytochrome c family protein